MCWNLTHQELVLWISSCGECGMINFYLMFWEKVRYHIMRLPESSGLRLDLWKCLLEKTVSLLGVNRKG